MNRYEALSALGLAGWEEAFAPGWDRITAEMPSPVPFLEPGFVRWACDQACLPPEMAEPAMALARHISADEALRSLAWYCHRRLFYGGAESVRVRDWPNLSAVLGPDAGMFYTLVLLSGTPYMLAIHRAHRVPPQITRDTMLDLKLNLETEDHIIQYGRWGISTGILGWLLNHWRGELYRLGRLQFAFSTFRSPYRAYRQVGTGAVVALSEPGLTYRSDGQYNGSAGIFDRDGAWTSTFTVSDDAIVANAVSPWGYAIREPVTLPLSQWSPAMEPGSACLDIHIPAGAPMSFDQCGDSIRQALDFFPRHFPDRPFVGFACHSWILDTQFPELLPPTSNLVGFQREVYLFPIPHGGGVIRRVFGYGFEEENGTVSPEDRARLPRQTTMQRAFASYMDAGGRFRGGGCFLLKEDLDWGSQVYRRRWPYSLPRDP